MKIYFFASISQRPEIQQVYEKIVNYLNSSKHEVYEKVLSEYSPQLVGAPSRNIEEWYNEWSEYVSECDVALTEASHPSSVEVGFEISSILNRGKPVILLHQNNRDPIYVNSLQNPRLIKTGYTFEDLEETLDWCIEEVESISKKRFTFYISPNLDEYLESLSKSKNSSKSEIIRDLLESEMNKKTSS